MSYPENPELPAELYNLKLDPEEKENRIDDPKLRDVVAGLRVRLRELKLETGYRTPRPRG